MIEVMRQLRRLAMENKNNGEIVIYQSENGLTHIDVKLEDEHYG